MTGFDVTQFAAAKAKPLPIILLLDESGSMSADGKIDRLNEAVKKMLGSFKKEETQASEFLVTIIGFGGSEARVINSPENATNIDFNGVVASGLTPLGGALKLAKQIVENKELTPSRAYRPLVILVTDGLPTDDWEDAFVQFVELGRSAKCDRMALAVGGDTDMMMLERFVAGTGHEVFSTAQADGIIKFFKFVTMSVVTRTRSQNPNVVPKDREVKPLPAPGTDESNGTIVAEYETVTEDPGQTDTSSDGTSTGSTINLDDEDDFWF